MPSAIDVSRPILSLRTGFGVQMMPQIYLLAQVVPILDACRLHPRSVALHVAVAERPAVPVELEEGGSTRPRRLRPSELTRLSMHGVKLPKSVALFRIDPGTFCGISGQPVMLHLISYRIWNGARCPDGLPMRNPV